MATVVGSAIQAYDDYISKLPTLPESAGDIQRLQDKFEQEFLPRALEEHGIDPDRPYKNKRSRTT